MQIAQVMEHGYVCQGKASPLTSNTPSNNA